ncbi:hypothetical protein [Chromobacterium sphagni]|uniref:Uncharacterized protein n=1 Tax=Chromobacterium sphagni TaxID=1903179 RepID=A0ABX3CCZ7_9NEIS|nr:hypothetical protein [Chromobacterium sphagni]OHX19877.1 hypothetical protein BI344_16185 [Chromobacterium sphagni]
MAHLVETMADVGSTLWHGLGNRLSEELPVEIWQREAGMDWPHHAAGHLQFANGQRPAFSGVAAWVEDADNGRVLQVVAASCARWMRWRMA